MLEVAVIAALLFVVIGFMAWDQGAPAISKNKIDQHGFTPGKKLTWQVPFIGSGVLAALAAAEFWALLSGSAPLWTSSRAGWQALHNFLGPYTNFAPSLGMAVFLLALGFDRLRRHKKIRSSSARGAA